MKQPVTEPIITSFFGPEHPRGIDYISGKSDRNLFAVAPGTFYAKGFDTVSGHYAIIRHAWIDGRYFDTYYGHLESTSNKNYGDKINEGEVIGTMGKTGMATGIHLHFEVRLDPKLNEPGHFHNGRLVDPELFLENYRLVSNVVRPAYISLYEVFLNRTPSAQDQKNFIIAGEDFRAEYELVKKQVGGGETNERK